MSPPSLPPRKTERKRREVWGVGKEVGMVGGIQQGKRRDVEAKRGDRVLVPQFFLYIPVIWILQY